MPGQVDELYEHDRLVHIVVLVKPVWIVGSTQPSGFPDWHDPTRLDHRVGPSQLGSQVVPTHLSH